MDYTQIIIGLLGVITKIFVGLIAKQKKKKKKERKLYDAELDAKNDKEAFYCR